MADDLWKSLQTQDRLIKLTIGTGGSPPIYIQQKILESVAPWFKNALKRDTFVESEAGVLSFPEDDLAAWKVLLCWITTRKVSINVKGTTQESADSLLLCTKCWALGDKYDIKAFQDEIMMLFLCYFSYHCANELPIDALNQILKTCPPDSKLAELLVTAIVEDMDNGHIAWSHLRLLDVGHIWSSFCKAQEDLQGAEYNSLSEFRAPTFKQHRGRRSMVGDKIMAGIQEP